MSWCKGGGGGEGGFPKQTSLQHLAVTVIIRILDRQTEQMLFGNVHTNIINILSISFLELSGGGAENNLVGSSISDQCYFYVKYYKKDIY